MADVESSGGPEAVERLVAENISEIVWIRLRRLTSPNLCKRLLSRRWKSLDGNALTQKSQGLAWVVRSSIGNWDSGGASLNARILTRYYAVLQASIAQQVASEDPDSTLERIQRHTEQGHGLSTIIGSDATFPQNYHIACLSQGHFASHCRALGADLKKYEFEKRPREWGKLNIEERNRLVSLADLMRRIPELQGTIAEYLSLPPLSFHIVHAQKNMSLAFEQMKSQLKPGESPKLPSPLAPGTTKTTYLLVAPDGNEFTKEY